MTTREFAAKIIEEHFKEGIDHLKSGWGHNFGKEYIDRRDNTYTAISLILRYWNDEEGSINLLIHWLKEEKLTIPWNTASYLAWNLYYSLNPNQTDRDLRIADKGSSMFSLLRSIELNSQIDHLNPEQQERLKSITSYIINS